ncbi:MAG: peptidoglycan DD-metalloendopeptidase family protein [Propionibacterium sp.]|nr:peptidoglycan DD-metalloendopeptidase family protein [Propionibacterium sp.]
MFDDALGRRSLLKIASLAGLAVAGGTGILASQQAHAASISSPVEVGARFTSGFRTSARPTHAGTDYGPPSPGQTGRPIYSIGAGVVRRAQWNALPHHTGIGIVIQHSGLGIWSYYGHLASTQVGVGQSVSAGQQIGVMGTTGNSTAIHLHLGIFTGSLTSQRFVNPHTWLRNHGVTPGTTRPLSGGGGSGVWPAVALPVTSSHTAASHNAWVKLMADIGYRHSSLTRNIQNWLKSRGYYGGLVDGVFGPMTVRSLQRLLRDRGFYAGVVDGDRGPVTIRAEIRFLNDQRRFY